MPRPQPTDPASPHYQRRSNGNRPGPRKRRQQDHLTLRRRGNHHPDNTDKHAPRSARARRTHLIRCLPQQQRRDAAADAHRRQHGNLLTPCRTLRLHRHHGEQREQAKHHRKQTPPHKRREAPPSPPLPRPPCAPKCPHERGAVHQHPRQGQQVCPTDQFTNAFAQNEHPPVYRSAAAAFPHSGHTIERNPRRSYPHFQHMPGGNRLRFFTAHAIMEALTHPFHGSATKAEGHMSSKSQAVTATPSRHPAVGNQDRVHHPSTTALTALGNPTAMMNQTQAEDAAVSGMATLVARTTWKIG